MKTRDLIELVEAYARHTNRSEATISNHVTTNARLFKRIRDGEGCTLETYRNALNWFFEHWPIDLEWPNDIPRPNSQKGAA